MNVYETKYFGIILLFPLLLAIIMFIFVFSSDPIKEECVCKSNVCIRTTEASYALGRTLQRDKIGIMPMKDSTTFINKNIYFLVEYDKIYTQGYSVLFRTQYFSKNRIENDLKKIKSNKDVTVTKYNIGQIIVLMFIVYIAFLYLMFIRTKFKQAWYNVIGEDDIKL